MLSIDKGLLGQGQLGDVVERHKKYGEYCPEGSGLDIIVLNKIQTGFSQDLNPSKEGVKLSEKVTAYPTNSKSKLLYYFDALKLGKKLYAKNKYDLMVCQEPFLTGLVGLKLKKKYKAKLLVHFHGDFRLPVKKVIKNADGIRVMSQGQKDKLIQKGIKENKIRVISTPVNIEKFLDYKTVGTEQCSVRKEKIILYVGRLEPVKNLDWFLNIFKNIVGTRRGVFKIIGSGSLENDLKLKVKSLNLENNVQFLGQLPQDEIIKNYYNSDVVVLSSKSESFGKVLVEANACGKPVVSTATTGAKEIIQDGYNGFLVPIGDAGKMAEKILYLLNNPAKAKEMGENGRKLVKEKYSQNTEKIIKFWQDII